MRRHPIREPAKPAPARAETVPLARIKDGGAQMRAEMHRETIDEYANEMMNAVRFPAIVVFDDGRNLWLADGYHRLEAKRKAGHNVIEAEIRRGTARDAILYAIGSNATHGLRRTQADKRRAVERLLRDPDWARWSDRKIAEIAKVDHKTVGTIRRELTGEFPTAPMKRKPNGEFPNKHAKPSASITADWLHSVSDDEFIKECGLRLDRIADRLRKLVGSRRDPARELSVSCEVTGEQPHVDQPIIPEMPHLPWLTLRVDPADQEFMVEVWIEKSTQNDWLVPLCRRREVNLLVGTGEQSEVRSRELVERSEQCGVPVRIIYISDFDPPAARSQWQSRARFSTRAIS
jgi:hypothetical protein